MSNARKLFLSILFTVGIAFSIVVVGRMVLLGYERLFDALLIGRDRVAGESGTPQVDLVNVVPTPPPEYQESEPPRENEDWILDFSEADDIPLPDPISIPPLNSLDGYTPGLSLELPVVGATGWAGTRMELRQDPLNEDDRHPPRILNPGQKFVILIEWRDWWFVRLPVGEGWNGEEGWVRHEACFINLPDVIPSIVFNITNASGSIKVSGEYEIPEVTGVSLYSAYSPNERFWERYMYIVPALYATAKRLFYVQQAALAQGDTLVVYEVFRPHTTQRDIVNGLDELIRENYYVRTTLNTYPWSPTWFISHGVSSHQRGAAVDASLARVVSYNPNRRFIRGLFHEYREITEYVMHPMPTRVHDLHPRAAAFTGPRSYTLTETMTDGAILLQRHFTRYGFSPLASEWWHFNDTQGVELARYLNITGNFYTESIMSKGIY